MEKLLPISFLVPNSEIHVSSQESGMLLSRFRLNLEFLGGITSYLQLSYIPGTNEPELVKHHKDHNS
jgi:hypothetical protein